VKRELRPFASIVQEGLMILLTLAFIFIAQVNSITFYKIGLALLIVTVLIQIPFGNIFSDASFKESIKSFVKMFLIEISVFFIAIIMVPYLVNSL